MFILVGEFVHYGGYNNSLYYATHRWFGHYRGGLAITTIMACAAFSAIRGSNTATAATMSSVAIPEMKKYKYHPKVRVVAYFRMSNAGTESPDESPRVKGFVNPTGTRYYQTSPTYVTVTETCNRNTQYATGTFGRYLCGEWATNPETASAWILADLATGTFKAGIEAGGIAEGQAGNGVPPTTGGTQASLDAAVIEIEVEAIIEPSRLKNYD